MYSPHVTDQETRATEEFSKDPGSALAHARFSKLEAGLPPLHANCTLRLYRDGCETLDPEEQGFFRDVSDALNAATRFIYLADWMFTPGIRLLRRDGPGTETLGALLVRKARSGVTVCVLAWRFPVGADPVSTDYVLGDELDGVHYYTQTRATLAFLPALSAVVYTHHQKLILCDGGAANNVVAFVGGLDLARGRWDTPDHQLHEREPVRGLWHADFYNGERDALKEDGEWPRQPWHDVHARVTGGVCKDLLDLFESRWPASGARHLCSRGGLNYLPCSPGVPGWQVLRLLSSPGRDPEILNQYLAAISTAERFIYIENQYFIGASRTSNGVPRALATRIAEKIAEDDRHFHVMVLLPLHPEGTLDPQNEVSSRCVGKMVHLQMKTIQMMLRIIGTALENAQRPFGAWRDYLSFFSLAQAHGEGQPFVSSSTNKGDLLHLTQRYMIYVHRFGGGLCVEKAFN